MRETIKRWYSFVQNIKLYDEEELSEDEVYDRYIRHNIKVANFAKTSQHYLLEKKGYTKGTILHRSTCNNTDYGYGIFTGEFEDSEEGVLLKFTDGYKYLLQHCTIAKETNKDLEYDIEYEIKRLEEDIKLYKDNFTLTKNN